ncbi:MAG: FUSC family membrane protein [Burkholderiaceae bacterium]|jgi:uncharacterized membrane protein YccC
MYDGAGLKKLLFSQYFYSGVQAALGVALVAIGCYYSIGLSAALGAAVGAVCVSIVDLPNPPHQKLYQTAAAAVLGTTVMLLMACASGNVWATGLSVLAVSFVSGMLQSYGRHVLALSFTLLFVVVIAIGSPVVPQEAILEHVAIFGLGAFGYLCYSLIATYILAFRTRQQALAESLFVLARYLRARARFYEPGADLDACYRNLVEEQMLVVEKQQSTRELVLRRVRSAREVRLSAMLLGSFDVYERLFASSTDYELLQARFGGSDSMLFLRDLIEKAAEDIEGLAYSVAGRRAAPKKISYKAERFALEFEINRLAHSEGEPVDAHGLAVLRGVTERILHAIAQIHDLHRVSGSNLTRAQILGGESFRPFLTSFSFSPKILRQQLDSGSPVFRFAVRLTAAMGCGYALAHLLPYATHGYWMLLTIAVVLRSSFSLTQQRRNDRMIGTVIGGMITALFLSLTPPSWLQMAVLFLALGTAHTFATIKYRYTAIAASVMALLQVHLLNTNAAFALPERLIDTLVGVVLAFGFSFMWPSWERQSIPQQIQSLLKANLRYLEAVLTDATRDLDYRLARKQLFDALAALTGSLRRMLIEPKTHHRAVRELNEFITLDYLLIAHAAAVHLLFEHRLEEVTPEPTLTELDRSKQTVRERLDMALLAWTTEAQLKDAPSSQSEITIEGALLSESHWTPAMMLERRLRLICETARGLAVLSESIARQW